MPISEGVISAIIGAAGAATGATINATAAGIRNRKQWKYWQKQHAINLRDWEMMNAYNSPLSQMRRYERAGLNPNLIYGQQNTTSELNSPPAPQYESPLTAIGEGFQNAVSAAQNRYVQMRQLQNQEQMNEALAKLYASKEELNKEQSALTSERTALENMKRIAYNRTDYYGKQGDILDVKLRSYEQAMKKLIIQTDIAGLQKNFLEKTLQNRILQSSLLTTQMQRNNEYLRHRNDYMFQHKNIEAWKLRYYGNMIPHQVAMAKAFEPFMMQEKLNGLRMLNAFNESKYPLMLDSYVSGNSLLEQKALREALGIELDMLNSSNKRRHNTVDNLNKLKFWK